MESVVVGLREQVERELEQISEHKQIEALKLKYLGRKGAITQLMKSLKEASPADRPKLGKLINELKLEVESKLLELSDRLLLAEEDLRQEEEDIDVSLPGRRLPASRSHPLAQTLDRVIDVLIEMGFSVRYGPDIDSDFYNFGALNFSENHPARDMQDTFYIDPESLLRTHTSNVQVRVMEEYQPPIRIISPGKCFRNEAISARSHVIFNQVEGLYIDEKVSFADLLATLRAFLEKLFYPEKVDLRIRPSYFPFVEPGIEVDVRCTVCKGKGCKICKGSTWLEILGAGMVHPNVLKSGGLDPEKYSGFAWGMGTERLAMILHNIDDIRLFWENDLRFLEQFS